MESSSEDDSQGGDGTDSGSNQKRELAICTVCASILVVSGSNRSWAPALAIEEGQLKSEYSHFVVCEKGYATLITAGLNDKGSAIGDGKSSSTASASINQAPRHRLP
ncbi:unnamed protein product [Linum trigynum]|uniref:Uncharacterized protein n=1 Tax=Linum trigynum TaxID=586398 RepID=A0AAV2D928_9ROSI